MLGMLSSLEVKVLYGQPDGGEGLVMMQGLPPRGGVRRKPLLEYKNVRLLSRLLSKRWVPSNTRNYSKSDPEFKTRLKCIFLIKPLGWLEPNGLMRPGSASVLIPYPCLVVACTPPTSL